MKKFMSFLCLSLLVAAALSSTVNACSGCIGDRPDRPDQSEHA